MAEMTPNLTPKQDALQQARQMLTDLLEVQRKIIALHRVAVTLELTQIAIRLDSMTSESLEAINLTGYTIQQLKREIVASGDDLPEDIKENYGS